MLLRPIIAGLAAVLLAIAACAECPAQSYDYSLPPRAGRHTPLHHRALPGQVGRWNLIAKPTLTGYFQPVQVVLPSTGEVTFYSLEHPGQHRLPAPAQAGMLIGAVYRLRVGSMPEYPGVELFPTIEVTDRLHPPCGREFEFPIPVEITAEEIAAAQGDQMVTKVVYLEQPQWAVMLPVDPGQTRNLDLPNSQNLLDAADQLGRPVAILRLGGRTPDPHNPYDDLLGPPPPIRFAPAAATPPGTEPPSAASFGAGASAAGSTGTVRLQGRPAGSPLPPPATPPGTVSWRGR